MGLYNFKPQFVPAILSGDKTHTIRGVRRYPDKPGNPMYLYTGLRTKASKPIAIVECVKVEEIEIAEVENSVLPLYRVAIDGNGLGADEREQLACRDGFSSFAEMIKFWKTPKNRLPFKGHIIHWKARG